MENNQKLIRLTEEDLKQIVSESVQAILQENMEDEGLWGRIKGGLQGIGNAVSGEYGKLKNGVMNTGVNNEYQGQGFKDRMRAARNQIKQNAKFGDRRQEFDRLIKQLNGYKQQGILGKGGNQAIDMLIKYINMSIRSDNSNANQAYRRNGYVGDPRFKNNKAQ